MVPGLGHVDSPPRSPPPGNHGPGRVGRRGAGECEAPGRAVPPLPPSPPEAASEPAASGSAAIFPPPSQPAAAPPPLAATTQRPGPQRPRAARRETRLGAREFAALGREVGSPEPQATPCFSTPIGLTEGYCHLRGGDIKVLTQALPLMVLFSEGKMSPFFGWDSNSVPPFSMTFKALA